MSVQSVVNRYQAFGMPGDLIFNGPQRADSLVMFSNTVVSGDSNTIGYAFTKSVLTNIAKVGGAIVAGTSVFAGILVDSKAYTSSGNIAPLAPTLNLPDNSQGEFLTMGSICVQIVANATQTGAKIGDLVLYNVSASGIPVGALSCITPGATIPTGWAQVPNAYVRDYPTTASGLIAITLTN